MDESIQQAIQEAVKESVEASRRTLVGEIGTLFEKVSEQNNSSQLSLWLLLSNPYSSVKVMKSSIRPTAKYY